MWIVGIYVGCYNEVGSQVVNALLTQLDKLKHKKNCLVMSTSNLATAIGVYQPSPNNHSF